MTPKAPQWNGRGYVEHQVLFRTSRTEPWRTWAFIGTSRDRSELERSVSRYVELKRVAWAKVGYAPSDFFRIVSRKVGAWSDPDAEQSREWAE